MATCLLDLVAWLMLSPHTIRALARAPSRPASIVGQLSGLAHVAETAARYASEGRVVLLADITNMVRNGDLICVAADDAVEVVECKVGGSDVRSPRVTRQRERAEALVAYLEKGVSPRIDGSGAIGDGQMIAIDAGGPTAPAGTADALRDAVAQARSEGSAAVQRTENEVILVGSDGSIPGWPEDFVPARSGERGLHGGFSSDLVNDAQPYHPPVTLWDLPIDDRIAVWEKDLIVAHFVRSAAFVSPSPKRRTREWWGSPPTARWW